MDPYAETFQSWNNVAARYQARFMDEDLYNESYATFCQLVTEPGARVLEIGCGPGNATRHLLARRPDFRLLGIDVAPDMVALARANNPGAKFQVLDARNLNSLPGPYDAVLCGFCLPYLAREDAARLFTDCAALLAPGGVAYFSCIEGDYAQSGYQTSSTGTDRMYAYYYQAEDLLPLLRAGGFELVEQQGLRYPPGAAAPATHLVFIVRKPA